MKKILTLMAVAAMAFTACSKEESTGTGDKQVRITPTIANPALTPASMSSGTRATDTDFELNDKVGLTITMTADGSAFVANKEMSFDGTDFKTEGFLWYEDVNATSTLFAYYPYQAGAAAPAEFSVKADQSGANYTASDLIVAVKTGVKPTLSSTQMTFKHKMSRIVISVTNESGFDIRDIVIKGAVGTGVLDPATGDFTAKAGAEASDVTANTATAEKVYYALLVPQNGVQLKVTVTTADGKMRTQTLGTTDLKSGENRRMDCNVQPADIQVKFSGPIAGWVDGDDLLPDGDGEVETPTVEWGGVKYKIVTLKDGRTWMAENLRYVPEGKTISSDPKDGNGVWYPCNLSKAADPSLTETAGLLYSYPVMLGMTGEMTGTNPDEGRVAQAGGCRQRQPVRPDVALFRQDAERRFDCRAQQGRFQYCGLRLYQCGERHGDPGLYGHGLGCRRFGVRHGIFPQLDGLQGYIQYGRRSGKRHQEHPVLCRYDNLQQELQSHDNRLPGWLWRCPGSLYQEQGVILTPAHKHTQHKQQ